jgi:hypothetical protein
MLNNFFRINLPYGIKRGPHNSWAAFNREYMPLGWNDTVHQKAKFEYPYQDFPIYVQYEKDPCYLIDKFNLYSINSNKGEVDVIYFITMLLTHPMMAEIGKGISQ